MAVVEILQANELLQLTKAFTLTFGLFFSASSQGILRCWGEDPRQALARHSM